MAETQGKGGTQENQTQTSANKKEKESVAIRPKKCRENYAFNKNSILCNTEAIQDKKKKAG